MNMFDSWFIDSCADLPVDGCNRNETAVVFRYKDGFLVLWNAPLSGLDLGRWCDTAEQLKTMLRGHWSVGSIVQWDRIGKSGVQK